MIEIPHAGSECVDENISDEEVFDDDEPEEEWLEEWLNESDEDEGEDNQHTENYVTDPQSENILSRKLRMRALSHRITHTAINDLLGIIRETTEYYVPMDARTFLKTPVNVRQNITTVAGGQLWYRGIEKTLQCHFK